MTDVLHHENEKWWHLKKLALSVHVYVSHTSVDCAVGVMLVSMACSSSSIPPCCKLICIARASCSSSVSVETSYSVYSVRVQCLPFATIYLNCACTNFAVYVFYSGTSYKTSMTILSPVVY